MRRSSSGFRSTDIANLESIVRNPYDSASSISSANPPSHIISKDSMALTKLRLALAASILLPANTACNRNAKLRIAVVPKGQTHIFWQSVHAGAAKAGQELGVEILWNGAAAENDLTGQIGIVENFISQHVDGIALAPAHGEKLIPIVEQTTRANVPVSNFDSGGGAGGGGGGGAAGGGGGGAGAAGRRAEI